MTRAMGEQIAGTNMVWICAGSRLCTPMLLTFGARMMGGRIAFWLAGLGRK